MLADLRGFTSTEVVYEVADRGPETELYFALVPYYPTRQAAGTTARQVARIDTHLASSPAGSREWGICTECGMGRVQAGDVPALLDLHRTVLDSHGANR